ncbi:MAG TPA: phosphoenolpyruvate--protein phosphotransferase, partial [Clostridiales bacterium]|nr:phosphoenolpyruvate--protein phosphotransferase [Clostridiales bacterium]
PFLKQQMEERIAAGETAESAADNVCQFFMEMFAGTGDELMEQRASDVKDIRDDLLGILLGVKRTDLAAVPKGSILVASDFTPSMTGRINRENVVGIIAEVGGVTSHSAILARAMDLPAVLSVEGATAKIENGRPLILDGMNGYIYPDPSEEEIASYAALQKEYEAEKESLKKFATLPTVTANGVQKAVYGNIGKPEDVQNVVQHGGEGIGLFRTEFLFMDRSLEPTEEEQFEAYSTVAKAMHGKEVIIRTLDVGGDKDIPYLSIEKEENPFLGFRAIRYCLKNTALFKRQLRAILRASAYGNVKIMLPLVTCVEEIRSAKALVDECAAELNAEGQTIKEVPVGIMVETPAAALTSDLLAKEAAFFSIGTNDLTGYIMAVDRGNAKVADLYHVMQPAVLKAIEMTIKSAKAAGIPVGMCGEAAADPALTGKLLQWGLDEFSVSPSSILKTRKAILEQNA